MVVCGAQLTGVVDGEDIDVTMRWNRDGSEFTGVPGRVTTTGAISTGDFVQNILSFAPLLSSDSGKYVCDVIYTFGVQFSGIDNLVHISGRLDVTG